MKKKVRKQGNECVILTDYTIFTVTPTENDAMMAYQRWCKRKKEKTAPNTDLGILIDWIC
jgi:hypothetical protein